MKRLAHSVATLALALALAGCGAEAGGTTAAASAAATGAASASAAPEAGGSAAATPAPAGAGPTIQWFGQSAFLVTTPKGTRVLMDPVPADLGYALPPPVACHVVTISHEHFDHTNVAMAAGTPEILRGLTKDKSGWATIDRTIGDVHIRTVGTYHDEKKGAERGLNAVFILEVDGWRIAHLGDLGHQLTPDQIAAIGAVDVLLVPVGGTFTIDAAGATKVVEALRPRTTIIPMHYKTDKLRKDLPLAPVDGYTAGKANVRHLDGTELKVARRPAGAPPEIVIMNYL